MNMILEFINDQRQELSLVKSEIPERLSCLVLTPRFRASSHIVYLIVGPDSPKPVLVAKVPRLAGICESLEREANNLRIVQASRPQGFDSIPRLVTLQAYCDRQILIETALSGLVMDPGNVRKNYKKLCELTIEWLVGLNQATSSPAEKNPDWFVRLVSNPLERFAGRIPLNPEEHQLLEQTRSQVDCLRNMDLTLVFEHGDLSHPNLFLLDQGGLGVVDWEQAQFCGLPACDLYFFLLYIAFARGRVRENGRYLPAFQSAFWGKDAWAYPFINIYARQQHLPVESLTPLFLLSLLRYLIAILDRLDPSPDTGTFAGSETVEWIRSNRYYALWRFAVLHVKDLEWKR